MEAAISSVLEEHVSDIQRVLQRYGFAPMGEVADRHGALQLTFAKESEGLARFILLNEAVGTGEDDYCGAIDVVAEAGDRFVRQRVTSCHSAEAFEAAATGDSLDVAVRQAESLTAPDLSQSYALRPQHIEAGSAAVQQ